MSLFGVIALALPYGADDAKVESARSANTCADPSLAGPVFQTFMPGPDIHTFNFLYAFENQNTALNAIVYGDLHPAFRAWPTQQEFTVPLFQLASEDSSQLIYGIGTDAHTPPVVSGSFPNVLLICWVYNSQVCGSVPLMSAYQATATDHYFTISNFTHNGFLASGWTDSGVVAYVLPLEGSGN